jgi:hypothetical protein
VGVSGWRSAIDEHRGARKTIRLSMSLTLGWVGGRGMRPGVLAGQEGAPERLVAFLGLWVHISAPALRGGARALPKLHRHQCIDHADAAQKTVGPRSAWGARWAGARVSNWESEFKQMANGTRSLVVRLSSLV